MRAERCAIRIRLWIFGCLSFVLIVSVQVPAYACTGSATAMDQAVTNGLPVVEQQVLMSSLPLPPFSGRVARTTVRAWDATGGDEVSGGTRDGFVLLTPTGCRPMFVLLEGWPGDRVAFLVYDEGSFVEFMEVLDAPGGLTDSQAAALTEALGPPSVTPPSLWDWLTAIVWAWWPHVALAGLVFGLPRWLRRGQRAEIVTADV